MSFTVPADRYNDGKNDGIPAGYTACYNSIELNPSSLTPSYGTKYTIQAKAYSSNSASAKTVAKSLSFTVPADRWQTGFDAGAPTGLTLGTKSSGTTWNVSIARGSYTAVSKTINLSSVYTDARSGYYTQAQYDAHYVDGWNAGWNAYYDDSPDWIKDWSEGSNTYSVWCPKKTTSFDYYNSAYGRGKGNGSSTTCAEWFRYQTGGSYSNTISVKQAVGYTGVTKFVAYAKTNTGYTALMNNVSGYWYFSPSTNLGNTSSYKVLHY